MNRILFISLGIVLIILLLAGWLYLLMNGAPASTDEMFSDLNIAEPTERAAAPTVEYQNVEDGRVILDLTDGVLQQVTTNPVAGFGSATTTGSTTIVRYVERGTGYVFEINLSSGLQTQVTPTTMANAIEAYFAPDLSSVVIVTEGAARQVTILRLPEDKTEEAQRLALNPDVENIQYLDENTITYTRNSYTNTTGFTLDLTEETASQQFDLPLPDATVWTSTDGAVRAFPRFTASLDGALYTWTDDALQPLSQTRPGFLSYLAPATTVISQEDVDGVYRSYRVPEMVIQDLVVIPEKCTAGAGSGVVLCGAPTVAVNAAYVDDWYKGVVRSDDSVWQLDTTTGAAELLITPKDVVGRQLDVINPKRTAGGARLLFMNKLDGALWLFTL